MLKNDGERGYGASDFEWGNLVVRRRSFLSNRLGWASMNIGVPGLDNVNPTLIAIIPIYRFDGKIL